MEERMKKYLLLCVLVSFLTVNVFAVDNDRLMLGTAIRNVYGFGPGLLLKTSVLPIHWGMNIGISSLTETHYN